MSEDGDPLVGLLKEDPEHYEANHLEAHVLLCRLRYDHIAGQLLAIRKVLWIVATILTAGTISSSLALWLK